jgi:hypothetical protein
MRRLRRPRPGLYEAAVRPLSETFKLFLALAAFLALALAVTAWALANL